MRAPVPGLMLAIVVSFLLAHAGSASASPQLVNVATANDQILPRVATFPGGGSFCAWTTRALFPPFNAGVRIRRLDGAGVPVGPEIEVNDPGGDHYLSYIGIDNNNLVVVFWRANDPGGGRVGTYARWFDANGTPLTLEYALGVPGGAVDMAPGGEFTIAWDVQSADTTSVYAQRFNGAGVPQGGTITVTTAPVAWPVTPSVAQLPSGFAVAWVRRQPGETNGAIDARVFDASGMPTTSVIVVTDAGIPVARPDVAGVYTTDAATGPALVSAATANGIAIVWDQVVDGAFESRTMLRRFDLSGTALTAETPVDNGIGLAAEPDVVADPVAGFAVVWEQEYDDRPSAWHIRGRRYDGGGTGGPELIVSPFEVPGADWARNMSPRAAYTADGGLQCVWMRLDQRPSGTTAFDIFANTIPTVATAVAPAPAAGITLRAWPNPFQASAAFGWQQPTAGDVVLEVYDVRGRRVQRVVSGRRTAGPQTARWDGTDGAGHRVATGVYYARLIAGGNTYTDKVVCLR